MLFHKRTSMSLRSLNFLNESKKIILQKNFLNAPSSTRKLRTQNSENNDNFCRVFIDYRGTILIKGLLSCVSEKCIIRCLKMIFLIVTTFGSLMLPSNLEMDSDQTIFKATQSRKHQMLFYFHMPKLHQNPPFLLPKIFSKPFGCEV